MDISKLLLGLASSVLESRSKHSLMFSEVACLSPWKMEIRTKWRIWKQPEVKGSTHQAQSEKDYPFTQS